MRTEFVAVIAIVVGAVFTVRLLDGASFERNNSSERYERNGEAFAAAASLTPSQEPRWNDVVRINAAPDNQFYVTADVNRQSAHFLVDTGASHVALRDTDARNAGIYTTYKDYTYPIRTANGETRAAFVMIDEIEIEGLSVRNVRAFILQDNQLSVNLLGMSFLSELESVEARRGELILRG